LLERSTTSARPGLGLGFLYRNVRLSFIGTVIFVVAVIFAVLLLSLL